MRHGGGGRQFRGSEVILHVYDLSPVNRYSYEFGFGAFHTGVEVLGTEYTYGGHEASSSGVFTHTPKSAPSAAYRMSISMGDTSMSAADVRAEVASLGDFFRGDHYHLILRNCNHFSDALVERLTNRRIPRWCNRLAYMGSWVRCLLPKRFGVSHPDSNAVQSSHSSLYARSGASSFQPFVGKGLVLAQEMTQLSSGSAHRGGVGERAGGEEGEIDRRALLAAAAMARFQNASGEASGERAGGEEWA